MLICDDKSFAKPQFSCAKSTTINIISDYGNNDENTPKLKTEIAQKSTLTGHKADKKERKKRNGLEAETSQIEEEKRQNKGPNDQKTTRKNI